MKTNSLIKYLTPSGALTSKRKHVLRALLTYTNVKNSPINKYLDHHYSHKYSVRDALTVLSEKGHSYLMVTKHNKSELLNCEELILSFRVPNAELGVPPVIVITVSKYYTINRTVPELDVITSDYLLELLEETV